MLRYSAIQPRQQLLFRHDFWLHIEQQIFFFILDPPSCSIGDLENTKETDKKREALPESTGCTLFKSIEKESSGDRSATASITSWSSVNMYATRPLRKRKRINSTDPMKSEVVTTTLIANFAALALPRPSSFDTLTLNIFPTKLILFSTCITLKGNSEVIFNIKVKHCQGNRQFPFSTTHCLEDHALSMDKCF